MSDETTPATGSEAEAAPDSTPEIPANTGAENVPASSDTPVEEVTSETGSVESTTAPVPEVPVTEPTAPDATPAPAETSVPESKPPAESDPVTETPVPAEPSSESSSTPPDLTQYPQTTEAPAPHDLDHPDHPVNEGESFLSEIDTNASETIKDAGDIIAKLIATIRALVEKL